MNTISEKAKALENQIINDRRYLHQHPELSCQEIKTTEYLVKRLEEMGVEYQTFDDITGCVATIKGAHPGKTVMLRSDIDALPITEAVESDYCSTNPGVMHACGHDCHMSMLLAAIKILKEMQDQIHGTVKCLFQMGEEIGRKSEEYVKRGALEGVDAIFGMHVWPSLDIGTVNFEYGERMACSDRFTIDVYGTAAHGSAPHRGHDALLAASACVLALQTIVSRQKNPLDSAVVTVGKMNGGTKLNILADHIELVGTVRAFNREFRNSMPQRIEEVVKNVAAGYGCTVKCDYYFGPSPLINEDANLVKLAQAAATEELGSDCLVDVEKMTSAEDFSVYLEHIPGVYGYLGCRNIDKGIDCIVHHPQFVVDEDVLKHGAAIYADFAMKYLNS